jgi:adenosylhomocysteine nucleosidase
MNRVAIIAAMPGELKPLVRGWWHERSNGVDLWRSGFLNENGDGGEWIAACAGAGVEAATRAFAEAERAFRGSRSPVGTRSSAETRAAAEAEEAVSIDALVSTGWAGALREELTPGEAYRVSGVIDARTGERFVTASPPNDLWLVTTPSVAGAAEKQHLASTYQADLVDMEAAGIARLAAMRGIPFYCVKGVSDGFSDQLPDFNRFISTDGQFRLVRFVVFALFRPWRWPALMRMGENSNRAAQAMASSLLDLLKRFA